MNWSRVEAASCGSDTACTKAQQANETCSFPVVTRANCRAGLLLGPAGVKGLLK